MRHVIAIRPAKDRDDIENGLVHYDGAGIISNMTLCGHVDQTTWSWEETTKRVNCAGCLGVRDHVLGINRKHRASKATS